MHSSRCLSCQKIKNNGGEIQHTTNVLGWDCPGSSSDHTIINTPPPPFASAQYNNLQYVMVLFFRRLTTTVPVFLSALGYCLCGWSCCCWSTWQDRPSIPLNMTNHHRTTYSHPVSRCFCSCCCCAAVSRVTKSAQKRRRRKLPELHQVHYLCNEFLCSSPANKVGSEMRR